ncbi:hypothetical protein DPMN_084389 [Dreissena polymorpha]|uniref:Uncharacterized protein n=1 Tax=Dreissena polymorpha TaxID=45954 RepID=A0A9D4BBZ2_DREPO|nr:hypothetical protein DPMN_084389 [Dreissena polymorpha]
MYYNIKSDDNFVLFTLTILKVLEIRENHLKTLPKLFSRLIELEKLDIGHNEFTKLSVTEHSHAHDMFKVAALKVAAGTVETIKRTARKRKRQDTPSEPKIVRSVTKYIRYSSRTFARFVRREPKRTVLLGSSLAIMIVNDNVTLATVHLGLEPGTPRSKGEYSPATHLSTS